MAIIDATAQVPALEHILGMSRTDLGRTLRVHPRTIDRWVTGDMPQRNHGRERLEEIANLTNVMVAIFGEEGVRQWLNAENAYLALLTPREVLLVGRLDRVHAALQALISGASV